MPPHERAKWPQTSKEPPATKFNESRILPSLSGPRCVCLAVFFLHSFDVASSAGERIVHEEHALKVGLRLHDTFERVHAT